MSQTGFTLSPRMEAILYFIGLVFVYLSSYAPDITAPHIVREVFGVLGVAIIVVKYWDFLNRRLGGGVRLRAHQGAKRIAIITLAVILQPAVGQRLQVIFSFAGASVGFITGVKLIHAIIFTNQCKVAGTRQAEIIAPT